MDTRTERLHDEFLSYKDLLDRTERESFSVVYNLVSHSLQSMEKGKAPDPAELKAIKDYLAENRDSEGIADEVIDVINDYMRKRRLS